MAAALILNYKLLHILTTEQPNLAVRKEWRIWREPTI